MKTLKKFSALLLVFSLLFSLGLNTTAVDTTNTQLYVYSQECPVAAIEYAGSAFQRHLCTSVNGGSFSVGDTITLGSPFTISSSQYNAEIYYFPVITNNKVVATFRVFLDDSRSSENNELVYTGSMSPFLAKELNSLMGKTSVEDPALLYFDDNDNIMSFVSGNTELLLSNPTSTSSISSAEPTAFSETLLVVSPFTALNTISSTDLISPHSPSRYLSLNVIETQGQNSWCYAYSAATIIRYCKGYSSSPTAYDIMKLSYSNPTTSNYLSAGDVVSAAYSYGLYPTYVGSVYEDSYAEIEANRPVFIRGASMNRDAASEYHGMVIRGYDLNSRAYSVWNPWYYFYETMDMDTHMYTATNGSKFLWVGTIYGWM